ncbi:MAG: hypothetical protein LUC37_04110, partial [Prevotella sp.]|nr:hypothetical protein [Prevotella sp.]
LDSYTESNYINTSKYSLTSVDYYDSVGILHSVTLYTTSQNGNTSYWDKVDAASSDYIKGNSHANNGVGIYINNKKSVHNDDANYEDKTLMYEETSSGDNHREVIMSGAERQFLIASSAESSNNMTYNNVLSVLKNGVLYLGGTIYNADGTAININGLDYMPDEIKINNPRLILGSNGYVYCQWDKFFNLIVNSDGTIEFGDNSLLSILNDIQGEVSNVSNTVNNTGSGSSSITTAGYYFDEDEVDVNI